MTKSKNLAIAIVFAALYATITISISPIAFGAIQLRVSEALKLVCIFFGASGVIGVLVGESIANLTTPLIPWMDFLTPWIGASVGLTLMYFWRRQTLRLLFATVIHNLMLSAWVAYMLNLALNIPFGFSWLTVFGGETVSLTFLGYLIVRILRKSYPNLFT